MMPGGLRAFACSVQPTLGQSRFANSSITTAERHKRWKHYPTSPGADLSAESSKFVPPNAPNANRHAPNASELGLIVWPINYGDWARSLNGEKVAAIWCTVCIKAPRPAVFRCLDCGPP